MITIRDAHINDAATLASAERDIAKTPGRLASRPHELNDHAFEEKIAIHSNSKTGKYVVIESGGEIVGHGILDPYKLEVTQHMVDLTIAIHEGHQGKGYGKALIKYLINWAQNNPSLEKINLHVRSSKNRAISLYKCLGFEVEGIRLKFIKIAPHTYLDNIAMSLWVGPKESK